VRLLNETFSRNIASLSEALPYNYKIDAGREEKDLEQ
jgi:hypothetical protein